MGHCSDVQAQKSTVQKPVYSLGTTLSLVKPMG
jgi:hypothetical protein